jgi:hypothetical protein
MSWETPRAMSCLLLEAKRLSFVKYITMAYIRAKRGVFLLGVLIPIALLAIRPDISPGELGALSRRDGVPFADGVAARKRGCCCL